MAKDHAHTHTHARVAGGRETSKNGSRLRGGCEGARIRYEREEQKNVARAPGVRERAYGVWVGGRDGSHPRHVYTRTHTDRVLSPAQGVYRERLYLSMFAD